MGGGSEVFSRASVLKAFNDRLQATLMSAKGTFSTSIKPNEFPFPYGNRRHIQLQMHQAPSMRDGHGFGAADGVQLSEDGFHVCFGGAFGDI